MNFFHHKDLGNHLLQLCPKVVKHPVYRYGPSYVPPISYMRDVQIPSARLLGRLKFCTVAPNICGPLVWNLLRATLLAPRILRSLLDFWKNFTRLLNVSLTLFYCVSNYSLFLNTCILPSLVISDPFQTNFLCKGKAIPLQTWIGPEGS